MIGNRYLYWHALAALVAFTLPVSLVRADVTFFGSVNPDPPGDFDVESTLIVGDASDLDPDFRGYVLIDGGTELEYDALIVGDDEGYRGLVIVSGTLTPGGLTQLRLEGSGLVSSPTLQVGKNGVGELWVEGGATMVFENAGADVSIGVETSGVGLITLTDDFSLMRAPDDMFIGDDGIGRLEILNRAMVHNTNTFGLAVIGASTTGVGSALVDGLGSIWKIENDLTIGSDGRGELTISDQGLVDIDRTGSITTIGARGSLHLDGGLYSGATTNNDGFVGGSGQLRGVVNNRLRAIIDVPEDGVLSFDGAVSNQGSIHVDGEAIFYAALQNLSEGSSDAPGRISLESGRLRLSQMLTNNGEIAIADGVSHLHGPITNGVSGSIVVASHAVAKFYDPLDVDSGSLTLLPGANLLALADMTFSPSSFTSLGLDELMFDTAAIDVGGAAQLGGTLEVQLSGDYSPGAGDSFVLLTAGDGVSGQFATELLPSLSGGLDWDVIYQPSSVLLAVISAGLDGDYNDDGRVDLADYTLWRDNLGAPAGTLPNDPVGGAIGTAQYQTWKDNFGASASAVAAATVPEPATAGLLALGVLSLTTLGARRRRLAR